MDDKRDPTSALTDEAKARGKWRDGETLIESDSDDVGLPASEADTARLINEDEDGRPGSGGPGTIPPPD